jgi:hypothetical protein
MMTSKNLYIKLRILFPGSKVPYDYTLGTDGKSEEQFIHEWHLDARQPTQKKIDSLDEQAEKEVAMMAVIENRMTEYPTWDEIRHAQLDGGMEEIQERRQAVKNKYPKP